MSVPGPGVGLRPGQKARAVDLAHELTPALVRLARACDALEAAGRLAPVTWLRQRAREAMPWKDGAIRRVAKLASLPVPAKPPCQPIDTKGELEPKLERIERAANELSDAMTPLDAMIVALSPRSGRWRAHEALEGAQVFARSMAMHARHARDGRSVEPAA